ncbi:MAG: hypothetical protein CFH22_01404 [Alphaproteobacteria bacterium MarineAlpha5_Bin12]|nr:MAG: hypothetical protein CFH22_01404 [Alphaproteobacteria bacterium MarineAlpha5_Bin12]|tara:strand:+ start:4349 stop:4627 length:279 start_codon:yes stop_codon:yes gene_type:complete
MKNKNKIFSDLSKIATDAFGSISGIRKEIETIVKIKIENVINKYDLIRRKEFEIVKKMHENQLLRINKLEKIILTKNKKNRNKVQKTRKKSK